MDSSSFLVFNSCIDICFFLDIIFTFRTSFYDTITGDEVFDKWLIARNYLKGRFIVDFLSTVPFDNIAKVRQDFIEYIYLLDLHKSVDHSFVNFQYAEACESNKTLQNDC